MQQFEIINKIGEGSFSTVYQVYRKKDGKQYALKKIKIANLHQKEKENALNEIRVLASIKSDFIISYKDSFLDDSLYIVLELANQGDVQKMIQDHIQKNTLIEENEIWKALVMLTMGLSQLHKINVLHRDIKPANVYKSKNLYKLGDMNVCKVTNQNGLAQTQTGAPYYASPEIWKAQPYSKPSDIWSLGCVIYEMTTLKPPFKGQDLQGLFRKIQSGMFDKIPKMYSKELRDIIGKMLKVAPQFRPSCENILNNEIVQEKGKEWLRQNKGNEVSDLMNTIKLPRNLNRLNDMLPDVFMIDINSLKAQYVSEQKNSDKKRVIRSSSAKQIKQSPRQQIKECGVEKIHKVDQQQKQQQMKYRPPVVPGKKGVEKKKIMIQK